MNVSRRHIRIGLGALAGLAVLSAGAAIAGNGSNCCAPQPIVTPPPGQPCCNLPRGHNVIVPGVSVPAPNIMVTTPNVIVNQGSVKVGASAFASAEASAYGSADASGMVIVGGGGGYYAQPGVGSSLVDLDVVGGEEQYRELITEEVPVTENVCVDQLTEINLIRPVRADCIDDNGTPHPASRLDDNKEVSGKYDGEIYRCMAGTYMQVTVGELVEGRESFAQGRSFSCKKGEALVHRPGGEIACAPQAPQRNCNERSLLRRYGPGVKLVHVTGVQKTCVPTTRTVMTTVTREVVREKPNVTAPIVFDGGVGQGYN